MRLCLLHLDDALQLQNDFIDHCERNGARHLHAEEVGGRVRLWGKDATLDELRAHICGQAAHLGEGPKLWFMGSGDFHHVSAMLIDKALEASAGQATVIHFDNHPDWVRFDDGMHCGSWVNRAAANPKVAKVITLGVASRDLRWPEFKGANLSLMRDGKLELFPFWHPPSRVRKQYGAGAGYRQQAKQLHWNTIAEQGDGPFLQLLLSRIATADVYLTIDKDVLRGEDAVTNWDQGHLQLPYLLELIRAIGQRHRIIGADVTGDYSKPRYGGSVLTRLRKRGEILLDQPTCRPDMQTATRINSAGNHALLDVLQQVMP